MFKGKVVAFALMLVTATSLYAGNVDDCLSNAGMKHWDGTLLLNGSRDPAHIFTCALMKIAICPQADFGLLSRACGATATVGADWIWIQANDASGNPIPGIPWTDYWLNACDPISQLCLCASPIVADSLTGADGKTSFSGRIAGGGCALSSGIWIAIQGKQIAAKPCPPVTGPLCLLVTVKGPDLKGGAGSGGANRPNCKIELNDFTYFKSSYNKLPANPAFLPCEDYNNDNRVNLSDFSAFGSHYGHKCQ